ALPARKATVAEAPACSGRPSLRYSSYSPVYSRTESDAPILLLVCSSRIVASRPFDRSNPVGRLVNFWTRSDVTYVEACRRQHILCRDPLTHWLVPPETADLPLARVLPAHLGASLAIACASGCTHGQGVALRIAAWASRAACATAPSPSSTPCSRRATSCRKAERWEGASGAASSRNSVICCSVKRSMSAGCPLDAPPRVRWPARRHRPTVRPCAQADRATITRGFRRQARTVRMRGR